MSRASSLDEMQLACDPSDPSLRFRVSSAQVHNWIDRCANSFQQTANTRKKAATEEEADKRNAAEDRTEKKDQDGEQKETTEDHVAETNKQQQQHSPTKQVAPLSAGVAAASISCAIRRFRHFSSATFSAGDATTGAGASGGVGGHGSPVASGDGASSPSTMMSLHASAARRGGHQQQQQQQSSPSGAAARASLLLNSGNSASVRRAAAHHLSAHHHQSGGSNGGGGAYQQQLQHSAVETVVNSVQLPSRSPVVDVEMARIWSQFPLLSARDTPLEVAFGASRLHRQVIQSIRAHPRSLLMALPPGVNAKTTKMLELPLLDIVHGQRIVVPIRSTACVVNQHPPMCLLGVFLLAAQVGTLVRPEADLCGVTTAGAQCTNAEALLCLCPQCQAPLTLGSIFMDRMMEKVLSSTAAAEESGAFPPQKDDDADDSGEVTRVAVDVSNFPKSMRVVPI